MKLGSSRGTDTRRPRGSERSKPRHKLRLTRPPQRPYPGPPEQAQPGVSEPCRTTCSRRICQLCRDPEASPQPGHDRLPLPSADTTQRFPRNVTHCTIIPGPKATIVVFVILQIMPKQRTKEKSSTKSDADPGKLAPDSEPIRLGF